MRHLLPLGLSSLVLQSCSNDNLFSDTGRISFWLYGIFILITVISMLFATYAIKKGDIEIEKLSKIIDLFKYAIVTIAIGTVTLIVSDLFKEREQDIKELEYFDKYVEDVKNASGIKERFLLSKYLSIVAPTGELKTSWSNYHKEVKIEYQEYLKLKDAERKFEIITNPSKAQIIKQVQTIERIKEKESPLVSSRKTYSSALFILKYPIGTLPLIFVTVTGINNDISLSSLLSPSEKEIPLPSGDYRLEFKDQLGYKIAGNSSSIIFKVKDNEVTKVEIPVEQVSK